ncbi:hypothetical protein [Martelella alba]|uniref:hypothetical protein n=1 Tax=Martelella alba TaxID=2590451 RepID=UPI00148590ED|nr:hypothetical protein [Martelella alba]
MPIPTRIRMRDTQGAYPDQQRDNHGRDTLGAVSAQPQWLMAMDRTAGIPGEAT